MNAITSFFFTDCLFFTSNCIRPLLFATNLTGALVAVTETSPSTVSGYLIQKLNKITIPIKLPTHRANHLTHWVGIRSIMACTSSE